MPLQRMIDLFQEPSLRRKITRFALLLRGPAPWAACVPMGLLFLSFAAAREKGAEIFPDTVVTNPVACSQNSCHESAVGSTLNLFVSVNFVNAPASFTPGETYQIDVAITGTAATQVFGFQLVAMHSDQTQAGTLTPLTNGVVKSTFNGVEHLFHSPTPLPSGSVKFQWSATSVANSDVILRIASNSANGNSDPSGDHINTKEVMIPAALVKDKKLYFAHFWDGQKGPVQLFSQITVVSLDASSSINATAEIFDNDGDPLIVDLNGEVVPGKKDFVVPAGGSVVLKTDGKGMVQPGSVIVSSDAPLSGVILFGGSVGVAGVGSSQPLKKFVAPMERDVGAGINTGVAIMSLENVDQTLRAELLDLTG